MKKLQQEEHVQLKTIAKSILLVISMSSVAQAQLFQGSIGDGSRPAPYPGPGSGLGPAPHPGWPGHGPRPITPPIRPLPPRPLPPRPLPPRPLPPRPMPPQPAPPYYPPQPAPGYGSEVKRIFMNRNVVNESIDLRAFAGLGYNYAGSQVLSVRANIRPSGYRTLAQLMIDGRIVATQMDPSYQISLYPQSPLVLDQTGRDLRLVLSGSLFVDSIDVEVRSGINNPGGNIDIPVYRSVIGNDRIDLTTLVNLSRYRGLRIQQVIVTGSTRYGSAVASLMINGLNSGSLQFMSGAYSQRQSILLPNSSMIGNGADSLVLYTSGDMTVEQVTLVVR
jgi:hypothetical protein